jgi:hypothetical protein
MPARYRVERGGTQRFSGTEAETGMMQRTSQSVSNNEAFRKLSVVMRAACANCKELVTSAHQDDIFAPYLTSGDRAFVKIANEHTLGKIALFSLFAFCHKMPPPHNDISPEWKMLTASPGSIIFLKIKIGWVLPEKWALDNRIDIRPLGDAAEFFERERALVHLIRFIAQPVDRLQLETASEGLYDALPAREPGQADTFAVEMLLAGAPIDQASILLGHTSVRVTEKHCSPWGARSSGSA